MSKYWGNTYTPHDETIYVSQSTPYEDLSRSIIAAFNNSPTEGIDVTFMGEVALKTAYLACLNAQAIILSQNPGLTIYWKLSRRCVNSRKEEGRVDVADFFTLVVMDGKA